MVDDQRSMVVILVFVAVFAIVSLNLDGITGMAVSAANNPVVIMSTELKIGDGTDSQGTGWVKPPTEVTFDVPLGVTYKKLIVESRGVAGGRDVHRTALDLGRAGFSHLSVEKHLSSSHGSGRVA